MEDKDFIGKEFLQNCGDVLKVLEKSNIQNSDKKFLFKYIFKKYPYEGYATKQNILKRYVVNPQIEQVEFIDKVWPQNCGDSLKIIRKTKQKKSSAYLWEAEFQKYPYTITSTKSHIIEGCVNNPQIEQVEFIGKEFLQYCGDTLKVLEKSNKKQNTSYLYKCEFQKYPCIIYETKEHILRGLIANPIKDEIELIGKEFLQNCGDTLKVLKKIIEGGKTLWKCEFIKYPYIIKTTKQNILNGYVINPKIEQTEFIGKVFSQNCGDDLKVIRKTNKYNKTSVLYECEFQKYPYIIFVEKDNIKNGKVTNPNLPYKSRENIINFIKDNFPNNHKPTLEELSFKMKISISHICNKINEFGLKQYINYFTTNLELDIKNFIDSLKINNIKNYWDKDINREIDILINGNLGIEINGNYWHSSIYKSQMYHQEKSLLFQDKNINILHIFEYEWLFKKDIIKSLIKSKLGIFEKRIFARQCIIKELQYKEYAQFCNDNHLQGEAGARIKLGLYYANELVQVISFSKPRFTDKYEYEIIRECSKLGYIILGGKERLFKYFLKIFNPSSVISYCDFSKFNGNSYLKLGFKKERLNKPGFVWFCTKDNKALWRNPYKNQEMKNQEYLKIYDAGQLVFVWNKI